MTILLNRDPAAFGQRAADFLAAWILERCALFTDLANPTSNKIYAEVGYRPLNEWQTIALNPERGKEGRVRSG